MSLPIPLAVRLRTARADRHVTAELRDLRFRSTIPGGFAAATLSFHRPLTVQAAEVDYYGDVTVYDKRTGDVVWAGWVEDPGRQAGNSGPVWSLAAIGSAGHARERTVPVVYVDSDTGSLTRADQVTPGGTAGRGEDPGGSGNQAVIHQFPQGLDVVAGSRVVSRYDRLMHSGQQLALFDFFWDSGVTHASVMVEGWVTTDADPGFGGQLARQDTSNVAGGGLSARVLGTHWTVGRNVLDLREWFTGPAAATIPTDLFWISFMGFVVVARRMDRNGAHIDNPAAYASTVLSSQVVEDLLGRLLPAYDGPGATIAPGVVPIGQLAYPDGVMPAGVLQDLMRLEQGRYWAAWERSRTTGRYRFEWVEWPTHVRYYASTVDGFDGPGSAAGLYDRVTVRYRDAFGGIRTDTFSQDVPELTAAGRIRQGFIDLGDELGGFDAATQAGAQFLADHRTPPNGGTLTIARPIMDVDRGRRVWPWEIRPGGLIAVRGVRPRPDALNPAGRDGATVFRVVGHEFTASTGAAVLDLDTPPVSLASQLAELRRTNIQLRRRR